MISNSHNFIFIHIYKVAGTSVRLALRPYAQNLNYAQKSINTLLRPFVRKDLFPNQPLEEHATALDYKLYFGQKYNEYFKFSFVRNPFDWQVSFYEYVNQTPSHYQHYFIKKMSFENYIIWRCREEPTLQFDFLSDKTGALIVDYVGKFENIETDFHNICKRIGVEAQLRHKNLSNRSHYAEYYNQDTEKLVANTFAKDFDKFGYKNKIK